MSEAQPTTNPNHFWRTRIERAGEPFRSWKEITTEVMERYGLTWPEMLSPSRERRITWPRQEAWALIWAQGRLSLPEIGRRFGRDHTTVLAGVRQYKKRLAAEGTQCS